MSVGFEGIPEFKQLLAYGEAILPELVTDPENMHWWRMQVIWTIAAEIGEPIELPEEIRGKYEAVKAITLAWAEARELKPNS